MSTWKLSYLIPLTLWASSSALAQAPQEEGAVPLPLDEEEAPAEAAEQEADGDAEQEADSDAEQEPSTAAPAGAAATHPWRVYAGFALDVGGAFVDVKTNGTDLAAKPALAVQLGADYGLLKFLAVSAEIGLSWVGTSDGVARWNPDKRIMLVDLVLKPRARYVFERFPIEVYGALPGGLTLVNMPDSELPGREMSGKPGATFGFMAGAHYFFSEQLGVNAELGWHWHWIPFEEEWNGAVQSFKGRLGQLKLLGVNFVYVL